MDKLAVITIVQEHITTVNTITIVPTVITSSICRLVRDHPLFSAFSQEYRDCTYT